MPLFLFADADYSVPINVIIWSICIGVNLGCLYTYYSRNILGSIVRRLLKFEGEENAKTIKELGYKSPNIWHKLVLRDGSMVRRLINVIGGTIPTTTGKDNTTTLDWEKAKFYIPTSNKKKAIDAYGTPQKWIFLPIFIVLSVLISVGMCFLMPFFIETLPFI